ncbi:MAG: dihydrofolate reductase family protein [Microlunatus sp.]
MERRGAWLFEQEQTPGGPLNYEEFISGIGAIAMGATTYQWVLDHLARTGESWLYPMPSWVFTHRDLQPIAGNVTITAEAVPTVHAAMAAAAGDLDVWVVGGGDLAAQFAEAGLLDEVLLSIAPVTLGAGRPLFPRRFDFRLIEQARNGAFLCARYAVVGPRAEPDRSGQPA